MTILVAVKKNGRVFLGADRITTFGNEYHTDLVGGQKIIKLRNAYLATSGYTLLDNIIEHLVATSHKMMDNPFRNRSDVFAFFLELYGEMRKAYTLVDTGKDTYATFYNVFLIVTPIGIYGVSNNLSVSEYPQYAAKGAGSDYALGCLYGLYDSVDDGYELLRLSLEAACHFSVYCKEPLDMIEVRAQDLKGPIKGYKSLGKGLRTMPKRKSPGNLLSIISGPGRKSPAPVVEHGDFDAAPAQPVKPRSASTTKNGKSAAKAKPRSGSTTKNGKSGKVAQSRPVATAKARSGATTKNGKGKAAASSRTASKARGGKRKAR